MARLSRSSSLLGESAPTPDAPRIVRLWKSILVFLVHYLLIVPIMAMKPRFERWTQRKAYQRKAKRFEAILSSTEDIETWSANAAQLDDLRGYHTWRKVRPHRSYCDVDSVVRETVFVRALMETGNVRGMGEYIRTHLYRNSFGVCSPQLFQYYTGTKDCVSQYVRTLHRLIRRFSRESCDDFPLDSFAEGTDNDFNASVLAKTFGVGSVDSFAGMSQSSLPGQGRSPGLKPKVTPLSKPSPPRASSRGVDQQRSRPAAATATQPTTSPPLKRGPLTPFDAPIISPLAVPKTPYGAVAADASGSSVSPASDLPSPMITATAAATPLGVTPLAPCEPHGEPDPRETDSPYDEPIQSPLAVAMTTFEAEAALKEAKQSASAAAPKAPQSTSKRPEARNGSHRNGNGDCAAATPEPHVPQSTFSEYSQSILRWSREHPRDAPESKMRSEERYRLLWTTAQAYGRTALMLSGGASLGMYHHGVVKALWNAGLLPKIICGSSAGAIIAGIFCTRTDEAVNEMLSSGLGKMANFFDLNAFDETQDGIQSVRSKLRRLFTSGAFMDGDMLADCLRRNYGDLTFMEAFELTGRVLNVSVAYAERDGQKAMLLNFITAPDVYLWSAVSASSSMPGLFTAVQLMAKDRTTGEPVPFIAGELWYDGSVACDLPKKELSRYFNVNHFIVSQVNPHIIPFFHFQADTLIYRKDKSWLKRLWFAGNEEFRHWVKKLFRVGLLPKTGMGEVPYLMLSQDYVGDITINPIGSAWKALPDFVNLTTNPTADHIAYVTSTAQRRTWPLLNQIKWALLVERTLDEELRRHAPRQDKNVHAYLGPQPLV